MLQNFGRKNMMTGAGPTAGIIIQHVRGHMIRIFRNVMRDGWSSPFIPLKWRNKTLSNTTLRKAIPLRAMESLSSPVEISFVGLSGPASSHIIHNRKKIFNEMFYEQLITPLRRIDWLYDVRGKTLVFRLHEEVAGEITDEVTQE